MKSFFLASTLFYIFMFTGCQEKETNSSQTITILAPNFDKAITKPIKNEIIAFEEKTGHKIRMVSPSWDDMVPKIKESFTDDKINYDIFVVFASWGGSLLAEGHAVEIPAMIQEKINWDDILPIYKNRILSWNHKYYFLPLDGDSINLFYRKDIFENKEYKKKFKKQYGYSLKAPTTWSQYKDIAQFFNAWDWDNDGKLEYGFAESRKKGYGTMLQFFAKAAAYAHYPNDKTFYFDMNMNPKINNPAFVKALEEYVDIMQYAPSQILNFEPSNVRQNFITGDVAMVIDWADTGAMAQNSKESIIKNKVGYAKLPGSNTVYNAKTKQWEKLYNNPSSVSGNWILVVNKDSKNQKLAFDFASFMTSKDMTGKYVPIGSSGINPSRYSHLNTDDLSLWEKNSFSKKSAKEYLDVISDSLSNENAIVDIRIPGADLYYASLDTYLNKAINKEISAKKALDLTVKRWNEITEKLGRTKQIQFYKESLNE